jgi:hypothetical protein
MSSGLAAPVPQVPRSFHDFLDPDSWPARQLETSLARLQSVQAVLKGMAYDMSKGVGNSTAAQTAKTTLTWSCYPTKVTSDAKKLEFENAINAALTAVTTAALQIRTSLGVSG